MACVVIVTGIAQLHSQQAHSSMGRRVFVMPAIHDVTPAAKHALDNRLSCRGGKGQGVDKGFGERGAGLEQISGRAVDF